jgi:translation initiation factor 1
MARGDGDRLVYSSEHGRICPACGESESRCAARGRCRGKGARARLAARDEVAAAAAADGIVRVGRSTKGRKGKTVSTVTGVPPADQAELAKALKQRCGSGGALKGGVIEIQGDHRDVLVEALQGRGYSVKRSG